MSEQSQSKNKDIFEKFFGKFVKVIYRDGSQLAVAKGVLEQADKEFLFIHGDFSKKIISKTQIEKMEIQE